VKVILMEEDGVIITFFSLILPITIWLS